MSAAQFQKLDKYNFLQFFFFKAEAGRLVYPRLYVSGTEIQIQVIWLVSVCLEVSHVYSWQKLVKATDVHGHLTWKFVPYLSLLSTLYLFCLHLSSLFLKTTLWAAILLSNCLKGSPYFTHSFLITIYATKFHAVWLPMSSCLSADLIPLKELWTALSNILLFRLFLPLQTILPLVPVLQASILPLHLSLVFAWLTPLRIQA